MLKTRLIVGSILIMVLAGILAIDHYTNTIYGFTALLFIVTVLALYEFYTMYVKRVPVRVFRFHTAILGICYIGLPVLFIYLLRIRNVVGESEFLTWLVIAKVTDTAAYFGGTLLGRHKLAPKISPNKTVEGLICALLVGSLVGYFLYNSIITDHSLIIGFIVFLISLAAVIGDLFESAIKRYCEVKDSARWLPGLGGILDLIDSLLISAPVAYFLLPEAIT